MSITTTTLDYASIESSKWRNLPATPGFTSPSQLSRGGGSSGAAGSSQANSAQTAATHASLKHRRAWDLAIAPAKSLPMQAFMLYMSGGGVQVFSLGIVFMLLLSPVKNVFGMNTAFEPFTPTPTASSPAPAHKSSTKAKTAPASPSSSSSSSLAPNLKAFEHTLIPQKTVYVICNLLTLAVGLWKCRSMGLLPTGTGDWLAFETRGTAPEILLR